MPKKSALSRRAGGEKGTREGAGKKAPRGGGEELDEGGGDRGTMRPTLTPCASSIARTPGPSLPERRRDPGTSSTRRAEGGGGRKAGLHVARAKIDKGVHLGYESWNTVQSASKVSRVVLPRQEVDDVENASSGRSQRAEALVRAEPGDAGRGGNAIASFFSGRIENARYFTQRHGTPTVRRHVSFTELVRDVRENRVDKVVYFTRRDEYEQVPVRMSRTPCLVVYHDRTVAQSLVPDDDLGLQREMEAHGVTVELTVEPMEGYQAKRQRSSIFSVLGGYIDETSGFGKSAVIVFPLLALGVLYGLSQVKARIQGDQEDRRKINIAKDEQKKLWKEQERQAQLRREAEEMAFQGYAAEEIFARMDRLKVPYDEEEIEDLVLLAKEGKLADPTKGADDDEELSFRGSGKGGGDQEESGGGGGGDETARFLKSAVKIQRVQDKRSQKVQQARLRKVGRKMQQRGVKFQYLDDETVTFKDVAGLPEVVYQLQEIVDFFQNPKYWRNVGARVPKGVLLEGPPGNGKTLMARAVAGEAGVSFLSINASEFVEMFIGVGAARVRDVFATARQLAPAIVFIDELDAVGRKRGGAEGNEERDQTVNQLLSEIDGFEESTNIVIMAATNRIDILDEALVRPGRFDRKVRIDLPESDAREAIFMVHASKRPLAADVDAAEIARLTSGMSGAELADVVNQGSLIAARESAKELNQDHFLRALRRGQLGDRIDSSFNDRERELVALQCAGVSLALTLLPALEEVEVVSTECYERLPLGRQNVEVNEQRRKTNQWTANYYEELLVATLAGYAADLVKSQGGAEGRGHNISTIHQSHLHMARHIASQLVMVLGATGDGDLPACPMADLREEESIYGGSNLWSKSPMYRIPYTRFSAETLDKAEQYRQQLLNDSLDRAKRLMRDNEEALDAITSRLLEAETIEGNELREIVRQKAPLSAARAEGMKGILL